VPYSGFFDSESAFLANTLLGNAPDAVALEIALNGGIFEAQTETDIAIVGADCEVTTETRSFGCRSRFRLRSGELLKVGPAKTGLRVYLAVPGGFIAKRVLDSVSGAVPEVLEFVPRKTGPAADLSDPPGSLERSVFRMLRGPQAELFDVDAFCGESFRVSAQLDRRGIRLDGCFPGIKQELPSEPACFGAIQITPSGMPVILGPDGPTIGGYPKIGVVISADLPSLGQLRPDRLIRFQEVGADLAMELGQTERQRLHRLRTLLLARI
jgi:allophanate hydrolase subunit 2